MVIGVIGRREGIAIEDGADIQGRFFWKRVRGEEAEGVGIVVKELRDQGEGPGICLLYTSRCV